jgi:hypothetical protein
VLSGGPFGVRGVVGAEIQIQIRPPLFRGVWRRPGEEGGEPLFCFIALLGSAPQELNTTRSEAKLKC